MRKKKLGKQSQHVRRVPTKKGKKRVMINPGIKRKKICVNLYGLADAKKVGVKDVRKDQLRRGAKVELEHTKDPAVAKKIALDHLAEFPDYYERLDKMEKEAESFWKKQNVIRKHSRGPDKSTDINKKDLEDLEEIEELQKKVDFLKQDFKSEQDASDRMIELFGEHSVASDILKKDKETLEGAKPLFDLADDILMTERLKKINNKK